jgi:hypothetical protein
VRRITGKTLGTYLREDFIFSPPINARATE